MMEALIDSTSSQKGRDEYDGLRQSLADKTKTGPQ